MVWRGCCVCDVAPQGREGPVRARRSTPAGQVSVVAPVMRSVGLSLLVVVRTSTSLCIVPYGRRYANEMRAVCYRPTSIIAIILTAGRGLVSHALTVSKPRSLRAVQPSAITILVPPSARTHPARTAEPATACPSGLTSRPGRRGRRFSHPHTRTHKAHPRIHMTKDEPLARKQCAASHNEN